MGLGKEASAQGRGDPFLAGRGVPYVRGLREYGDNPKTLAALPHLLENLHPAC